MKDGIVQSIIALGIFHPPYFYITLFVFGLLLMFIARKLLKLGLKTSISLGITAVIAILGFVFLWGGAHTPGSDDRKQAELIVQTLVSKYPPLKNSNFGEGPTIYTRPQPGKIEIYVYGVTNDVEQDKIISIVQSAVQKPLIFLTFYEEEKFTEQKNKDGSITRKRFKQEPIRQEQLTAR